MNSKLWVMLAGALGAISTPAATAASVRVGERTFTVADGFELRPVTTTNLVLRPVNASFDDQGRLYVTDASGSSEPPAEQAKDPQWRLVRLEDSDGDGVFDRSLVVADRLPMLQGVLWHPSGVYIGGTPAIWKLSGFDGAGRASQRMEWWNVGQPSTHCGNEVHGPYRGPDGLIYWTKGAFEPVSWTNSVTGRTYRDRGAHIFRARPDGSAMESLMTGGMDNPVGLAFLPDGELLFTSTFIDFTQPGFRDGVGHASYGAVFGKENSNVEDRAVLRTSPELMHPFVQLGAAAPSGLTRYTGTQFGPGFADNLLVTEFNHRKVSRHALRAAGATFAAESSDFVTTDDMDFHPTDVVTDGDGSVLIVDTGGWYKLCCPSSQLWKPDVLGTIYRVSRTGAPQVKDPWGNQLAWTGVPAGALRDRLGDPRPAVRERARVALAALGGSAVAVLKETFSRPDAGVQAVEALWTLAQIADPSARAAVREVVAQAPAADAWERGVDQVAGPIRRAALKIAALWRDTASVGSAGAGMPETSLLMCAQPAVRRNVAELLGRTGATAGSRLLLNSTHETIGADPVLNTAVIRALIDLQDAATLETALSGHPGMQRAALVASAEIPGSTLKASTVAAFLVSTNATLRENARWLVQRRPEWNGDLVAWFRRETTVAAARPELLGLLPIFTGSAPGRALLGSLAAEGNPPVRIAAFKALGAASSKEVPAAWWAVFDTAISGAAKATPESLALAEAAIRAAGAVSAHPEFGARLASRLTAAGANTELDPEIRLRALSLGLAGRKATPRDLEYLQQSLLPPVSPTGRALAAEALGRTDLTPEQLNSLLTSVRQVGPLELNRLIGAFDRGGDETLGLALIEAIRKSPGVHGLAPGQLAPHFAKFPPPVQAAAQGLIQELAPDTAKQSAQLTRLLAELQTQPRDVRRGQAVFNSPKAACSACHRIGYQGGNLGPDLTSISNGRTERDLLEAVVFPSASFVRSYEPVLLKTKAGDEFSGLIRRETETELVLATGPGAEQRLARADIRDRQPGTVSVMPSGLDTVLSRQELADLLAFLRGTKWGAR